MDTFEKIIIISGPSGAGKGSIIAEIRKEMDSLETGISVTTRLKRPDEKEGREYYFVSQQQFDSYIQENAFVEWCEVHGNYYGTLKKEFERIHRLNKIVLLEIDTKGALKIKALYPNALFIFIAPPDIKTLQERLEKRNTDSPESIKKRLKTAVQELKKIEYYDYVVINDTIMRSKMELISIIENRYNLNEVYK